MKLLTVFLIVFASSYAGANEMIPSWQASYIANGTKTAILELLPDQRDEVGPLLHALAVIDTPETLESLIDLADYYFGEANGEDYFALVVNKGRKAIPLLERKLRNLSSCLGDRKCLSATARESLLRRIIEAIQKGEKVELIP